MLLLPALENLQVQTQLVYILRRDLLGSNFQKFFDLFNRFCWFFSLQIAIKWVMPFQTPFSYSKLKEIKQKQSFAHTLDSFLRHSELTKCVNFSNHIRFEVLSITSDTKLPKHTNGLVQIFGTWHVYTPFGILPMEH